MCSAQGEYFVLIKVVTSLTNISVSMSLRLPNMLRFTSWMAECVDFLEASPDAAPTDKLFVSWVRLQHIVEEAAMNLGLDSDETVSLGEERVQLMLKTTEKQLESWKKDATALGYTNNSEYHRCNWCNLILGLLLNQLSSI